MDYVKLLLWSRENWEKKLRGNSGELITVLLIHRALPEHVEQELLTNRGNILGRLIAREYLYPSRFLSLVREL